MEAPKSIHQPISATVEDGKACCKCDEGWTCTITKTEPSKAGKPYSECSGSCTCTCTCVFTDKTVSQASDPQHVLDSSASSKVFCECGEGWSCVITKTEGPQAGKTFFECGEGCVCVIDETNTVKVACT